VMGHAVENRRDGGGVDGGGGGQASLGGQSLEGGRDAAGPL